MGDMGDYWNEHRDYVKKNKPKWDRQTYTQLDKDLARLEELGFTHEEKNSWYQVRINGTIDIYPQSQSYHDIKKNKRGMYKNLVGFIKTYFERK
jgi:hypothetical protein